MANILSYRIGDPRSPQLALERVASLGIRCVEVSVPPEVSGPQIKGLLSRQGLTVASLDAPCPLADDKVFGIFERCAELAVELSARVLFTSVHAGEMPLDTAYARLRRIGDIVAKHFIFVAMETHPDLCQNGAIAAKTMAGIDHPNIGVNYDTANVYYYNQGVDTAEEVKKIAHKVVSVHLKDTMGGYHDGNFPDFGLGVVDFGGVFKVLNGVGFRGPFTMELEGPAHSAGDPNAMEKHVAACVKHLRGLGLV
jgi:sugar phosphate isomerase/epimerase